MDSKFDWREEYNIGVDEIDKEHRQLFRIINKLLKFQEEEKDSQWLCQEGIKFFKGHALKHFEDEEAYMESIGYKGLEQHRKVHKGFRENTLGVLEEELERTGYSPEAVEHFLGVCTGWLIGHTTTEDLAITGKGMEEWKSLLPEEEVAALKKVIVQLVFDMFHLESQLISDAYGGEKFGRGVYFHLVYGTQEKEEWQEVILVFEEKLLVNTVGKVLGIKTNKLDSMLVHAARYVARQFVKRVMKQFPAMESYELLEENLLSYDNFRKMLRRENLQVSMLFNTGGAGYFAYCVSGSHLLQGGAYKPVEKGYSMTEVEKYLMERKDQEERDKGNKKQKVLVVDDSKTLRQFIGDLLSEDYEVFTAESGMAAIQMITLERPDLVLLDYEMPVCDGRQTLEMLRSEKDFADLPVIFLTGKGDPESVKKVMKLKPAGYLLKTLKAEVIREEVNAFFAKKKA